jgi:hypothetical protein
VCTHCAVHEHHQDDDPADPGRDANATGVRAETAELSPFRSASYFDLKKGSQ